MKLTPITTYWQVRIHNDDKLVSWPYARCATKEEALDIKEDLADLLAVEDPDGPLSIYIEEILPEFS
jgi:hypothetical protein